MITDSTNATTVQVCDLDSPFSESFIVTVVVVLVLAAVVVAITVVEIVHHL